ncbi:M15 family metallopeptidase [Lysobacter spongiae]|uniref:M15 family metallopeptidase n=2 Tax=Marilutibacter spongiae TaxID=2025720 RepID=A0A7W3Y564_9GAMM|nr:M15 family metallopeptidase [Lysobacter spongiae]
MKTEDMIRAVQRKLGVVVDGRAGPQTWGAIHRYVVQPAARPRVAFTAPGDRASDRSERAIAPLLPEVRPYARALYFKARSLGITLEIISGLRSFEEQDRLYAQGRSTPGTKVTGARGGHSTHNFGIAFDIGIFSGNRYLPDSPAYQAVGALGIDLGLEWGGNWKTLVDRSHFQLRPQWALDLTERRMLTELRRRVRMDEPVF